MKIVSSSIRRVGLWVILSWVMLSPQRGEGKMMAMRAVPMKTVLSSFAKLEGSRKLTQGETVVSTLAKVGSVALGITSVSVPVGVSDDLVAEQLQPRAVHQRIIEAIRKHPRWDHRLSATAIAEIVRHRAVLEESLGKGSYAWAWALHQSGETVAARKILSDLYEAGFREVMQLKAAVYGLGASTPLSEVEYQFQALEPMSDPETARKLQSQMQQMKIHVSNLPQSHIKT